MSIYRTLLAALAAVAIASPVFADDNANVNPAQNPAEAAAPAQQNTDNGQQMSSADQAQDHEAKLLNLNKATAKQLMKIQGVDAAKARAIVAYRKKHGSFKSLTELSKVKGFAKVKADSMQKIQDQLSLE